MGAPTPEYIIDESENSYGLPSPVLDKHSNNLCKDEGGRTQTKH